MQFGGGFTLVFEEETLHLLTIKPRRMENDRKKKKKRERIKLMTQMKKQDLDYIYIEMVNCDKEQREMKREKVSFREVKEIY